MCPVLGFENGSSVSIVTGVRNLKDGEWSCREGFAEWYGECYDKSQAYRFVLRKFFNVGEEGKTLA